MTPLPHFGISNGMGARGRQISGRVRWVFLGWREVEKYVARSLLGRDSLARKTILPIGSILLIAFTVIPFCIFFRTIFNELNAIKRNLVENPTIPFPVPFPYEFCISSAKMKCFRINSNCRLRVITRM